MGNLLSSLPKTVHASLALAVIFFLGLFYGNGGFDFDTIFLELVNKIYSCNGCYNVDWASLVF